MRNILKKILLPLMAVAACLGAHAGSYVVKSPSQRLTLTVKTGQELTWRVDLDGREIIKPSTAAVMLADGSKWGPGALVAKKGRVSRRIATPRYSKAAIDDSYSMLTLSGKGFVVEFRAYDDAVAYRFRGAGRDSVCVKNEQVEYNLSGDPKAWVPWAWGMARDERYSPWFESYYDELKISEMPATRLSILPLLADMGGGVKVAVTDIGDIDYPGMFVHSNPAKTGALVGEFAGYPDLKRSDLNGKGYDNFVTLLRENYIARVGGRQPLSWKVAVVTADDAQLADCDITEKLCAGTAMGDYSWVKPGKVAWDWWNALNITGVDFISGMNTPTYKYFIDFAAANKLEYVIIDDGWDKGDVLHYKDDLDIPELCRYAEGKGVGIIIWLKWKDCMKYLDRSFALYKSWGVKGLKIDYVQCNDQYMMSSLRRITQKAADCHLIVEYHGMQLKGMQVAYPNILSVEGVRGMEQCRWSEGKPGTPEGNMPGYDVMIPFIRQIISPMDYTPGAMINATQADYRPVRNRPMSQGTRTHQLAMYAIFFSPLQMLCDSPTNYMQNQECTDFISKFPTTFDESRTLMGEVGKYIVVARRKGATWYVGAMAGWDGKDIELPLSFLGSGAYHAEIFADGVNANRNAEDYRRTSRDANSSQTIKISMKSGGGWAARFEK